MRVKCNWCEDTATGLKDNLIARGWSRAIIYTPFRKTITACPAHQNEFNKEVSESMNR